MVVYLVSRVGIHMVTDTTASGCGFVTQVRKDLLLLKEIFPFRISWNYMPALP